MSNIEYSTVLIYFSEIWYTEVIKDGTRLNFEWNKYMGTKYNTYLNYLAPISFVNSNLFKTVLNKLGIKMTNKNGIALAHNLMRCEAHFDISKKKQLKGIYQNENSHTPY